MGGRKWTPQYSASPSEIALLHDDPTHAGAAIRGALSSWSSQMPDSTAGLPPRFLRTPEAARYLGLSGRTLEKHRTYGTGPTYRKIGGRVVYAVDDLKAWADLGAKTSTSDPGKGTVLPAKKHPVLRPYAGQERR
jgi:predicted DNA-binding transcriptional regulator AlpA